MGSIVTRKDGRRVIQWIDGAGRQRQEALKLHGLDGKPLSKRAAEQEGRRRLAELEEKARRQRHGLEPLPSESEDLSFGALLDWWWEQHGKTLRSPTLKPFLERHLRPGLGKLPLREVTTARIQRFLADKTSSHAPKTVNILRAWIHNIFNVARQQGGPWEGRVNPAAAVERYKVTQKPRKILAPDEWLAVLAELPAHIRTPAAVGLYAGLREGEIFGMRKEDVDLDQGLLMVSRSWDGPHTKDGKMLQVPIAQGLRPYVEEALRSKGPLLFPKPDGSMYPRDLRLGDPLRAAIARAGFLEGYEHRCRAWHCGWRERRPDENVAEACPKCGKPTLWAKRIPRHVTFHGTRHSFGTAIVRAAGTAVAQKALRHSDVRLTIHTYGHLDVEDVRQGIAAATKGATVSGGPSSTDAVRTAGGLRGVENGRLEGVIEGARTARRTEEGPATPQESRGHELVGETGFEFVWSPVANFATTRCFPEIQQFPRRVPSRVRVQRSPAEYRRVQPSFGRILAGAEAES